MSRVVAEYLQCMECNYTMRIDKIMAENNRTRLTGWLCPCGAKHSPDIHMEPVTPKAPIKSKFQSFWDDILGPFQLKPLEGKVSQQERK